MYKTTQQLIRIIEKGNPLPYPSDTLIPLFKGKHNEWVYYSFLWSTFAKSIKENTVVNGMFECPNKLAEEKLNLSERQITKVRTYLVKENWITISQEHLDGKTIWLVLLHEKKLKEEIAKAIEEGKGGKQWTKETKTLLTSLS